MPAGRHSERPALNPKTPHLQADTDLLSDRRARMEEWREWYEGKRTHREQMAAAAAKIISARYPDLVDKPDDYTLEQARRDLCQSAAARAVSCSDGCASSFSSASFANSPSDACNRHLTSLPLRAVQETVEEVIGHQEEVWSG
jgi:hypothetical protein